MNKYCDSDKLEKNWFLWLLSSSVPELEYYRNFGLLWTKIIGVATGDDGKPIIKNGRTFPNAMHPKRLHCIISAQPLYFESNDGKIPIEVVSRTLPQTGELSLLSHKIQSNDVQYGEIVKQLQADGYILEASTDSTWHAMLEDVNKMCYGIATKFNLPTEEEHLDFANEALLHVTNKLRAKKLVYTPGRAPVFNLLTTTIYRVMYSIMNRRKSQKQNLSKLMEDIKSGRIMTSHRSLRIGTKNKQLY